MSLSFSDPAAGLRLIAFLLIPSAAVAQASAPPEWTSFTRMFQTYVDSDHVVGASVVLVKDGNVVARYETGDQDRARHLAVDDQTIYHWASITKTLTAISIMQLRDRGKLTLDDKVVRWVPELRLVHDPYSAIDSITIRMLLSHTAGFQNPTWPYTSGKPWEPFEPTTWNQLVAMMPYQELHFRPGTRYSYSNPGFIYLARIIEQITGDPWDAYVQKNIFAPLGLDRSYFRTTPYYLAAHRSHNYYVRRDSTEGGGGGGGGSGREQLVDNGADFDPGITSPNGAWNSPLGDLAKYVAFLTDAPVPGMSRDRYSVVLARTSLEEMWRPVQPMAQSYEAAPDEWMGLSFFILQRGGRRLIGHTGSQAGFRSFMYFNPQNGAGIIAAFNTTNMVAPATTAFERMRNGALDLLR